MDCGSCLKMEVGKIETDGSSEDITPKENKSEEESRSALTVLKYDPFLKKLLTIHHEDDMVIPYGWFNDYNGLLEHLLNYLGIPIYPRYFPLPEPSHYVRLMSDYYFRNLTGTLYNSYIRRDNEGRIIYQFSTENPVRQNGKFSIPPDDAYVKNVQFVSALLRTKNSVDFIPWSLCGEYFSSDGGNKNYARELEAMAECVLVIWRQN